MYWICFRILPGLDCMSAIQKDTLPPIFFAAAGDMKGFAVLHPMGWDAFGLPAERYAMQTNIHPKVTTEHNIDTFRRQIKMLGLSYDWDREINTTDPKYYKWTQWIFLKIYNSWFDSRERKARPIRH